MDGSREKERQTVEMVGIEREREGWEEGHIG